MEEMESWWWHSRDGVDKKLIPPFLMSNVCDCTLRCDDVCLTTIDRGEEVSRNEFAIVHHFIWFTASYQGSMDGWKVIVEKKAKRLLHLTRHLSIAMLPITLDTPFI